MHNGLFIDNEFIALISLNSDGEFTKWDILEHAKVFLYFTYNIESDPPIELNEDARFLYYPGNPEILGDTLNFINNTDPGYKLFDKEYLRFDILDSIIRKIFSENSDKISHTDTNQDGLPFLVILPPFLSGQTRDNILNVVKKNIKTAQEVDYVNPYISSLLLEDKLNSLGNVLFVDVGFSDFSFSIIKPSYQNQEYEIKKLEDSTFPGSEIVLNVLKVVAGDLVDKTITAYDHASINDDDFLQANINKNIGLAQDILNEVNKLDEWNSVEIDVELSNGKGGQVTIKKDELIEKINGVFEKTGIDSKIQYFIDNFQPKTIVLYGENFEKCLLGEYFEKYTECQVIKHNNESYKIIF